MADEKDSLITPEMLKERFIEKLKGVKQGDATAVFNVIAEHLIYSLGNYDCMTSEAQKITDEQNNAMYKHVEDTIKDLPDSVMVRQAKRLIRGHRGKRWHVKLCIDHLEKPLQSPSEMELRSKVIFDKYVQLMVDMYQDILEHAQSGVANFSQIGLFGTCFDELFIAFHLSQRSYAQQAYSHLRTIQEALDLIALFRIKPEEADLWASDEDWHVVWKELSPKKVKAKIGSNDIFGKFYHLFSDVGTHPSFNMMRMRCRMLKEKVGGRPQIYISVGGTPKTREAYFCHVFLVATIVQILGSMLVSFHNRLNMKEVELFHEGLLTDFRDMIMDMLVKPLNNAEAGRKIEATFNSLLDNLKKVFNSST